MLWINWITTINLQKLVLTSFWFKWDGAILVHVYIFFKSYYSYVIKIINIKMNRNYLVWFWLLSATAPRMERWLKHLVWLVPLNGASCLLRFPLCCGLGYRWYTWVAPLGVEVFAPCLALWWEKYVLISYFKLLQKNLFSKMLSLLP